MVAVRSEGLSKSFGKFEAMHSLTLDVEEGEVLGYLGPNGAGKATTIRLLLGPGLVAAAIGLAGFSRRDLASA